jgi:MFS family permease
LFAVSLLAGVGLVAYELRRREPLLEMRFFRSAPFSGATVIAVSSFAAFAGFLFLNTLYLQDVRGYSPLQAGLCTLPMAVMALLVSPLSGRLVGTRGARVPLLVAGACMLAGAAMLTALSRTTPLAQLLVAYGVFGVGFGMVNPPITYTAVSGMPDNQAGVAAGIASTSRQVGQTLGVAVAGSIVGTAVASGAGAALAGASHPAWWLIAACGGLVAALGLLTTGRWARATARRASEQLRDERPALAVS